jgi:hypothetical protein
MSMIGKLEGRFNMGIAGVGEGETIKFSLDR